MAAVVEWEWCVRLRTLRLALGDHKLERVSKRLIEEKLPHSFLCNLGLYLQTCAHIELMLCALICELESLEVQSEEWIVRHSSLRKMKPAKLFAQLTDAANRSDRGHTFEHGLIDDLVAWMKQYIQNRHIAAHGAFFIAPNRDILVNYWHVDKSVTPHLRTIEKNVISDELVRELIDDADRILRVLWGAHVALGVIEAGHPAS